MSENLRPKTINQLLDQSFYIPYYQRGYRWTTQQVKDLLNDIWAFVKQPKKEGEFYCLQPVVVKEKEWDECGKLIKGWEVVDGQQRLTTLYIIIKYLAKEFLKVDNLKEEYGKELFSLKYETRPDSARFLNAIEEDKSNIDFYHIHSAYQTVQEWFTNGQNTKDRTDKDEFLKILLGKEEDRHSVKIIWYHVDSTVNSIDLFTRLNIGKIPLTNAELVKALFLNSSSFSEETNAEAERRKLEISLLWDEMEQKLSEKEFWAFVTNESYEDYQTKIELILNLISKKKNQFDPFHTFLYFLNQSKNKSTSLWKLWLDIEQYYLTLCEWFKSRNYYHKVGYLITIGHNLGDLIEMSLKLKKSEFDSEIDKKIKAEFEVLKDKVSFEELSFENNYNLIQKILLLFNIESIRANDNINEYYPFKFHKKLDWSLEHIHAQNSEGLSKSKRESWFQWLKYHADLIRDLMKNMSEPSLVNEWQGILAEMDKNNNDKLTWEQFDLLSQRIIKSLSGETEDEKSEVHSISNLALLSLNDNSALNNSVFEVKRREIIEMDKKGRYIPVCTRRVFLKYYANSNSFQQYYFWSKEDRDNYVLAIKQALKNYLPIQKENLN